MASNLWELVKDALNFLDNSSFSYSPQEKQQIDARVSQKEAQKKAEEEKWAPYWKAQHLKFLRGCRKDNREKICKNWKQQASPILEEILSSKNPRLEGLTFGSYTSTSDGSGDCINTIYLQKNGNWAYKIHDLTYGDIGNTENYAPKGFTSYELSQDILLQLHNMDYGQRNKLVKDLEKRTGRNIKKELKDSEIK